MGQNYQDFFQQWEIAVIKNLVNQFQQRWKLLKQEGWEDLLQECFIYWLPIRDDYEGRSGSSPSTFMASVIRHKLNDIVKRIYSEKRSAFYQTTSLHELFNQSEGAELMETSVCAEEDSFLSKDLRIDLSQTLIHLTPQQQEICHLLGKEGLNVTEVSQQLNLPRSSVYEEIKRIRVVFQKRNLKEYWK